MNQSMMKNYHSPPLAARRLQAATPATPFVRGTCQQPLHHNQLAWLGHRSQFLVSTRTAQIQVDTLLNDPAPIADPQPATEQFSWTKAWYPAAALDNLDPDKPNKFTLLGRDYVLWADAAGAWHCFADRCPHRLATLSDGLVDKQRGEIVCAYHGWRFQGDGKCTSIPQALDATSAATACASKRSCATALPTAVGSGLLWVWPDEAATAPQDAAAAALPLLPQLESLIPLKGRWMVRDLPYSWDFFVENVMDPTHVDFAHHGVAGFDAGKFVPHDIQLKEDCGPAGFVYQVLPSDPHKRGSFIHFCPPSLVTLQPGPDPEPLATASSSAGSSVRSADARPGSENPNVLSGLVFYVYPTKPGWCRLHGTSWVSDRQGQPLKTASLFTSAMPVWLKHVLGFEFFAGDDVFLGAAAKKYVAEGEDWRRSYYLPTRADAAITAMRRWLDKYAGGGIPFPPHMQGRNIVLSNLNLTPRQAMDRFSQHVQHCTHCKAALARTQATAAAAVAAAVSALVGACLAASVRATAAMTPAAVPGWLAAVSGCGGQLFGLSGPLLLLGLVAVGVHVAAKKVEQLFYYREFTRPAF